MLLQSAVARPRGDSTSAPCSLSSAGPVALSSGLLLRASRRIRYRERRASIVHRPGRVPGCAVQLRRRGGTAIGGVGVSSTLSSR